MPREGNAFFPSSLNAPLCRSHVRGLRYFKNLLYMHRETRLELLASAVPDLVKESENSKYRKRDHYPDIVLYPTRLAIVRSPFITH